jgi:hypothetical protein
MVTEERSVTENRINDLYDKMVNKLKEILSQQTDGIKKASLRKTLDDILLVNAETGPE